MHIFMGVLAPHDRAASLLLSDYGGMGAGYVLMQDGNLIVDHEEWEA